MDLTGKAVYISGRMTGCDNWNTEAFDKAADYLIEHGAAFVFNPSLSAKSGKIREHSYYMRVDIHELTKSYHGEQIYDVIAMLPGWEESYGARVELMVAIACGIEVMFL